MTIAGAVFAGGKSSRYGKPKMFETYKGKQLYEYSVEALSKNNVAPIYIVTNDQLAPSFTSEQATIIKEQEPHLGPLHALHETLTSVEEDWVFVLAADIPFVHSSFISTMIAHAEDQQKDAIVPIAGERFQPLLALYHKRCLPVLEKVLKTNRNSSMKHLLDEVRVNYLPFSNDVKVFTNINRREDWPSD